MKKLTGSTTTVYIFSGSKDIAEYDNGAAPSSPSREFVYGNGQLLAEVASGTTTYYQSDHLSVRMTTNSSGSVVGQQGHFPYGESWYSSNGSSEWIFTTYQHDPETGLEYALARYYDTRTGGFCSADPVESDPSDPESWNRYVYARDNPINISDPSGKSFWSWLGAILAGITAVVLPEVAPELFGSVSSSSGFIMLPSVAPITSTTAAGIAVITIQSQALGWQTFFESMASGAALGAAAKGISIDNVSTSGPQQATITERLNEIKKRLPDDSKCAKFLARQGKNPLSIVDKLVSPKNEQLAHADITQNGNGFINAATSHAEDQDIFVNNNGAFFHGVTPGGQTMTIGPNNLPGGTPAAQAFVLLHELGHLTGVLKADAMLPKVVRQNDKAIQANCGKTIGSFH